MGQLGTGAAANAPDGIVKAVMKPTGVTGWKLVLGGRDFSLAIASNGTLWTWGKGTGTTPVGRAARGHIGVDRRHRRSHPGDRRRLRRKSLPVDRRRQTRRTDGGPALEGRG